VEIAETETLFANPGHDYSRKLLSAIPALSTNPARSTRPPRELA